MAATMPGAQARRQPLASAEPRADNWETNLRPPRPRAGAVPRAGLIERLRTAQVPVVAIVAPAGYGKSTLLAEWASQEPRSTAWLSVDERDNDPSVLLSHLAAALDQVDGAPHMPPSPSRTVPSVATAAHYAHALGETDTSFVLMLDHLELLTSTESRDVVAEFALNVPVGSHLAFASRAEDPVRISRLRTRRGVMEIGVDELAMDEHEASALLASAGVALDPPIVRELLGQTEGWPVGLYLSAQSMLAQGGQRSDKTSFHGDDWLMADYFRAELLSRLTPEMVTFLTRTAVLDRLSGALCEAVLGTGESGRMLEAIASSNALLVPLDRQRSWYRYHHLFGEMLRFELERTEPALVPELHARAATWYEANGMPQIAIEHSQAGGDAERSARLTVTLGQPAFAAGHDDTLRRWIRWFEQRGLVEQYPEVAVLAALVEAVSGHPAASERWSQAAESATSEALLPDGSPVDSWIAFMRAQLCPAGPARMRADAVFARDHSAPRSIVRGGALVLEGVAALLEGDSETADAILAHAIDVSTYLGAFPAALHALGTRANLAADRLDWTAADELVERALSIVADVRLEGYVHAGLAYVAAARVALHRGDVSAAHGFVIRAAGLRPLCTYAMPPTAHILVQLGFVYLELSDPAGARTVLREVSDILQQRPDLGVVAQQAETLRDRLDAVRERTVGASSLTASELRLLPFLATHLSFPEIGERLHVSRHTVKTQAISVYRKLGVSSRSEAIQCARDIGLLAA